MLCNAAISHSASMGNLMEFQIQEIKSSQGEQVCCKDYKNNLHENLENGMYNLPARKHS